MIRPKDLAAWAYMTGATLDVNGGVLMV